MQPDGLMIYNLCEVGDIQHLRVDDIQPAADDIQGFRLDDIPPMADSILRYAQIISEFLARKCEQIVNITNFA